MILQVWNSHMARPSAAVLEPRKTPRQARSAATVEAIHTAAIQVLLAEGVARLTTTRVAERAGVSVGTMYQYFPHKEALLFALVRQQVAAIALAIEQAAVRLAGKPLAAISDGLVEAWLEAKVADIGGSRAIYGIAAEFDIAEMIEVESKRLEQAVETVLESACDATVERPGAVAFALLAVMGGATRTVLERGGQEGELTILRAELPRVCRAYLASSATVRADPRAALTPA
jgi:AcrR family transcriptional regulator